jgi:hypothetical protein
MTCEKCHQPLSIGDYPFCPHGSGSTAVEAVTWPGGRWFENLGDKPEKLYSPLELRARLKELNLEPFVRHLPGDQHTRSWATMDPYTLEQARILAERQGTTKASGDAPPSPETVRIVREVFQR